MARVFGGCKSPGHQGRQILGKAQLHGVVVQQRDKERKEMEGGTRFGGDEGGRRNAGGVSRDM